MAISPTIANFATRSLAFGNFIAELMQYDDWEVQDGSYNGVQFHVVTPAAATLNPAQGAFNYLLSPSRAIPLGSDIGALTITDAITRKLAVYKIPNRDGDIIEDYGSSSPTIRVLGIMTGITYTTLLSTCNKYFNDSPADPTVSQSQQTGNYSGVNFRVLVHPFFGIVNNVFLQSWRILHTSERYRSATFELVLFVQDPTYLSNQAATSSWQSTVQYSLDLAEALVSSIMQTFSLSYGLTTGTYPFTSGLTLSASQPLIDTKGVYITYTEAQLNAQLQSLSNVFLNSVAFLVQNSGGQIVNSYFDTVEIDYSLLPVYTTASGQFTYSDAQSIITNYSSLVDSFITTANAGNYDYFLQQNLNALRNSVVTLNDIAKTILMQDRNIKMIVTDKMQSLTEIIIENGADLTDFDLIAAINNGQYFSSCAIPSGTTLELIL